MTDNSHLPDRDRSAAILIGAANFATLPPIQQAAANVVDLATRLSVEILNQNTIIQYVDPVNPAPILQRLGELADLPLDLLLVYYVGHGLRDSDDRLCLALPGSLDNQHDTRRSSLPVDAVFAPLRRAKARHPVVVLDCCYAGLAWDERGAADLHLLTAAGRTEKAGFGCGRHTNFTGELLHVLSSGVPDGPRWLTLDLIHRHLQVGLGVEGRPVPTQRCVDQSADVVLGRNPAYGTALTPEGLRSRAYHANGIGLCGDPRRAATLFAAIVADQPDNVTFRRAHARWVGESGDPRTAVSLLEDLMLSHPDDPALGSIRRSHSYWSTMIDEL